MFLSLHHGAFVQSNVAAQSIFNRLSTLLLKEIDGVDRKKSPIPLESFVGRVGTALLSEFGGCRIASITSILSSANYPTASGLA